MERWPRGLRHSPAKGDSVEICCAGSNPAHSARSFSRYPLRLRTCWKGNWTHGRSTRLREAKTAKLQRNFGEVQLDRGSEEERRPDTAKVVRSIRTGPTSKHGRMQERLNWPDSKSVRCRKAARAFKSLSFRQKRWSQDHKTWGNLGATSGPPPTIRRGRWLNR